MQTSRRRIAADVFEPARMTVQRLEHAQIIATIGRLGDPECVLAFLFRILQPIEAHVGLDQGIDGLELLDVEQTVEVAHQVHGAL
jgi:hypothetical protein